MIPILGLSPDKVIYCGDTRTLKTEKHRRFIRHGVGVLSPGTVIDFLPLNPCNVDGVCQELGNLNAGRALSEIVIDLTGGESLIVFALGKLAERNNITAVVYRPGKHVLLCVNGNLKKTEFTFHRQPTIAQMISVVGGSYLRCGHGNLKNIEHLLHPYIIPVFHLLKSDAALWRQFTAYFQQASKNHYRRGDMWSAPMLLMSGDRVTLCPPQVFQLLRNIGMLRELAINVHTCRFRLQHPGFRSVLSDFGIWLELYVTQIMKRSQLFDCVETSVVVCWNEDQGENGDVENEIDIVASRGIGQLFVSCKTSQPDVHALNELKTISNRFGSKYAVPLLVTLQDLRKRPSALLERAAQMGVEVICGDELEEEVCVKRLATISRRWGSVLGTVYPTPSDNVYSKSNDE